jgi:hypothetical protein
MRTHTLSLFAGFAALALASGCEGMKERVRPSPTPEISNRDIGEAAISSTRYYNVTGAEPVYQVMPGESVFAKQAKAALEARENEEGSAVSEDARALDAGGSLYSNNVERVNGEITVHAIDRWSEDEARQKASENVAMDKAEVVGWFTTKQGQRYEFRLDKVAPSESQQRGETHFGGVGSDITMHGDSGFGTPLEPKVKAAVAIFGNLTLSHEGKVLGEFPAEVLVTSRTRGAETGKYLGEYDTTKREAEEIHLLIHTTALDGNGSTLPAGQRKGTDESLIRAPFHVVWGNASVLNRPSLRK